MIYTEMTLHAMRLAYEAHAGQTDRSGVPYIFHPIHVAEQMTDELTTCVALLHDVLEDTAMTAERLAKEFPPEVVEAVVVLTHHPDEAYGDYIRRAAAHPVARVVKIADLAHNSDRSRLTGVYVPAVTLAHWDKKYAEARKILGVEE